MTRLPVLPIIGHALLGVFLVPLYLLWNVHQLVPSQDASSLLMVPTIQDAFTNNIFPSLMIALPLTFLYLLALRWFLLHRYASLTREDSLQCVMVSISAFSFASLLSCLYCLTSDAFMHAQLTLMH